MPHLSATLDDVKGHGQLTSTLVSGRVIHKGEFTSQDIAGLMALSSQTTAKYRGTVLSGSTTAHKEITVHIGEYYGSLASGSLKIEA